MKILDWANKKLLHKPSSVKAKRPVKSDGGILSDISKSTRIEEEIAEGIMGLKNAPQVEILTIGTLGIGNLLSSLHDPSEKDAEDERFGREDGVGSRTDKYVTGAAESEEGDSGGRGDDDNRDVTILEEKPKHMTCHGATNDSDTTDALLNMHQSIIGDAPMDQADISPVELQRKLQEELQRILYFRHSVNQSRRVENMALKEQGKHGTTFKHKGGTRTKKKDNVKLPMKGPSNIIINNNDEQLFRNGRLQHLHEGSTSNINQPLYCGFLEVPTKEMECYNYYASNMKKTSFSTRSQLYDWIFHESSIDALIRSRALHCSSPSPPTHVVSCQNYIRKLPHAFLLYRCLIKYSSYHKGNSNIMSATPPHHFLGIQHNNKKVDKVYQILRKSVQGLKKGKCKKSSKSRDAVKTGDRLPAIDFHNNQHECTGNNVNQNRRGSISDISNNNLNDEVSLADISKVLRSQNSYTTVACSRLEAAGIINFDSDDLRNIAVNRNSGFSRSSISSNFSVASSNQSTSSTSSIASCMLNGAESYAYAADRESWINQHEDSNSVNGCWIKTDDEYLVLEL